MKLDVASYIIARLKAVGINTFFGLPGGQNLSLYRCVMKDSDLRLLTARHEQGAAFMADGYNRFSGLTAGVLLVPGPGVTNALTAIATAEADSVSMVVLAPFSKDKNLSWAIHEMRDQRRSLEGCMQEIFHVAHIGDLVVELERLVHRFSRQPPVPLCLHFPNAILEEQIVISEELLSHETFNDFVGCNEELDVESFNRFAGELSAASRPLLVAGWGVVCAGAEGEFNSLAVKLNAATATTTKAKGVVNKNQSGYLGCLWSADSRQLVAQYAPDVTVVLGSKFSHRTLAAGQPKFGESVIHIDIDSSVVGKNLLTEKTLVADARTFLRRVLDVVEPRGEARSNGFHFGSSYRSGSDFVDAVLVELRAAFIDDGCLVCDNAMIGFWIAKLMHIPLSRRWALPTQFCPLGYALPAAIGASFGKVGKPTVVIGDGGALFTIGELAVAVEEKLAMPVIIFNDSGYGSVVVNEAFRFGSSITAHWQSGPNFSELGRAFGAHGVRLYGAAGLGEEIAKAKNANGPTVIEICYDERIPWPI